MAGLKLTNNASTLLASSINDSVTELSVTTGTGALFPTLGVDEWFPLIAVAPTGDREIMRCTARTGDLLTVVRAQEGTAAMSFDAGARIDLRLTAGALEDIADDFEAAVAAAVALLRGELNAPAATRSTFPQTAAPTGWTKDTTHNNKALRVVSGAASFGGSTPFASVFTARQILQGHLPVYNLNHTLTLPNHTHFQNLAVSSGGAHSHTYDFRTTTTDGAGGGGTVWQGLGSGNRSTSSDGSHSHALTGGIGNVMSFPAIDGTISLSGGNVPMDFNVQYVDLIIAQKD